MVKIPAEACMAKSGTMPVKYRKDVLVTMTKFLSDNTIADLELASEDDKRLTKSLSTSSSGCSRRNSPTSTVVSMYPLPSYISITFKINITIKFHAHELAVSEVS
jgi:hypothetical protein